MNNLLRVVSEGRSGRSPHRCRHSYSPQAWEVISRTKGEAGLWQIFRQEKRRFVVRSIFKTLHFTPFCGIGWGNFSRNWCGAPFLTANKTPSYQRHGMAKSQDISGKLHAYACFMRFHVPMQVDTTNNLSHQDHSSTPLPIWFHPAPAFRPHCWHVISWRFVDVNLQHTAPNSRHEGQGKIA